MGLQADQLAFETLQQLFAHADVSGSEQDRTGPIPVVSFDQQRALSLLTPIQAFRWFIDYGGRFGSQWQNLVTRVILRLAVLFHPLISVPYLHAPVLMLVGREDEMVHCNPKVQRHVFEKMAAADKTWIEIDKGHFGLLYPNSEAFRKALRAETEFLKRVLL